MRITGMLLAVLVATSAWAQSPRRFSLTANAQCAVVNAQNNSTVGIIVSGTWVGTLTPTLQIAGVSGAPTASATVTPSNSTTSQATITGNGGFKSAVGGFTQFNLCFTAFTSGTAVVDLFATQALNAGLGASGGGGPPTGAAGGDLSGTYPNPGVAKVNGGTVAGTSGDLASFGASNVLADSGLVAANEVNAVAPGAGLCHFAGGTQTCTSSLVVNADIVSMAASKLTGATAPANGGVASVSGTGSAGFISAGIGIQDQRPTATIPASAANQVRVFKFILPYAISLSRITANVSSGNTAATNVTFGIYDNAGTTKLIDSGLLSTATAGIITGTFTPVVLNPGAYWFAQSETSATPNFTSVAAAATSWEAITSNTNPYTGTAANAAVAGVLPATLGVVTASNQIMVLAFWEP